MPEAGSQEFFDAIALLLYQKLEVALVIATVHKVFHLKFLITIHKNRSRWRQSPPREGVSSPWLQEGTMKYRVDPEGVWQGKFISRGVYSPFHRKKTPRNFGPRFLEGHNSFKWVEESHTMSPNCRGKSPQCLR